MLKRPGRFLFLLILLLLAACQQAQSPEPAQLSAITTVEISEVEPAGTPTLEPATNPPPTETALRQKRAGFGAMVLDGVPLAALDGHLYVIGGSGIAGVVSNRGDLFMSTPANFSE